MGKKKDAASGGASGGGGSGGAAATGVEAMEVRHILVEKHSQCLKVRDPEPPELVAGSLSGVLRMELSSAYVFFFRHASSVVVSLSV